MTRKTTIPAIFVPGLGDERTLGQDKAVKAWQFHGVELEYFPVGWADGEAFEPKLDRLVRHIDELHETSGKVALIGASAGAGCVLNAAAARPEKVRCVVSICGKILHPNFKDPIFTINPAFAGSLKELPASLESLQAVKMPILSVNSLHDGRVPREDTVIHGAQSITMPMVGHVPTIAYALTLGKRRISRWITTLPTE